jgi:hypothetical protein
MDAIQIVAVKRLATLVVKKAFEVSPSGGDLEGAYECTNSMYFTGINYF